MAALLWRGLRPAGTAVCMARLSTARSVHSLRPLVVASRVSTRPTEGTTDRYNMVARSGHPYRACFSNDAAVGEKYKAEIFDLTNFYMEAKDALEDAHESWETTYFDEDFEAAKEAVTDMKDSYASLREKCTAEELPELEKIVGLKLEEIKAAFEQLEEMAIED